MNYEKVRLIVREEIARERNNLIQLAAAEAIRKLGEGQAAAPSRPPAAARKDDKG